MAQDIQQARNSRERVSNAIATRAYYEQEQLRERWEDGKLPPQGLLLGYIPTAKSGRTIRKPRTNDDK
jgi:hypothetical protein